MAKRKHDDSSSLIQIVKRRCMTDNHERSMGATSPEVSKNRVKPGDHGKRSKRSPQLSHLELLPTETLQEIVLLLPPPSILSLRFVSRTMQQVVRNDWTKHNEDRESDKDMQVLGEEPYDEEDARMRFKIESEFRRNVKLLHLHCSECLCREPSSRFADEHKSHRRRNCSCLNCLEWSAQRQCHFSGQRIFRCENCNAWTYPPTNGVELEGLDGVDLYRDCWARVGDDELNEDECEECGAFGDCLCEEF